MHAAYRLVVPMLTQDRQEGEQHQQSCLRMLPAQQQQQYAPNAGVAYTCGECGHENVIKLGDVIRCCSCCCTRRLPGLEVCCQPGS